RTLDLAPGALRLSEAPRRVRGPHRLPGSPRRDRRRRRLRRRTIPLRQRGLGPVDQPGRARLPGDDPPRGALLLSSARALDAPGGRPTRRPPASLAEPPGQAPRELRALPARGPSAHGGRVRALAPGELAAAI